MLTTIVLADDHELILESVASLLSDVLSFKIVGKCRNGRELIKCVESLHPNIAVVDIAMPELNGIDAVRRIGKTSPATRIIALSLYSDEAYIREMVNAGICGYVIKGGAAADLIEAIRTGGKNYIYFSSEIADVAKKIDYNTYNFNRKLLSFERPLTMREKEVLQMVGEGYSSKDIASKLNISEETVKTHRGNLMDKLNVRDVAGLTRESIRLRLVHVE